MAVNDYPYDASAGVSHLRAVDASLAALCRRVGPYRLRLLTSLTPFQALIKSIVYQQLSGKAARSIYRRLIAVFPGARPPTAQRLAAVSAETLRAAGLSRAKVAALQDLAALSLAGVVPNARVLKRLPDEAIIERLTQVRGVGCWTVQMLLIFHLGRADVLPAGDLGVRRGLMLARGLRRLPEPDELKAAGEAWRPYRSVASWYLWRANELEW